MRSHVLITNRLIVHLCIYFIFMGSAWAEEIFINPLSSRFSVKEEISRTVTNGGGDVATVAVGDEILEKESANWDIFTNRSNIRTLLLSDDGTTLWWER